MKESHNNIRVLGKCLRDPSDPTAPYRNEVWQRSQQDEVCREAPFSINHFISLLSNVRGEEIHYELSSIQMHFGESPQEGHYTITFKNKDTTWTMVSDTFLNRYQAFKGLSGSRCRERAYIFAYRRLSVNPALGESPTFNRTETSSPKTSSGQKKIPGHNKGLETRTSSWGDARD